MKLSGHILVWRIFGAILCSFSVPSVFAQETADLQKELQELREQNRLLQNQLQQQRDMIDQLNQKFSGLEKTNAQRESDLRSLKEDVEGTKPPPENSRGFSVGNVVVTGEGGAGFFETGSNGKYPNAAFRVDEARLFFDAPIWDDVYFYGQVDLITPQAPDNGLYLGELYLQFENLAKHWDMDQLLNARLGQFYIPFGEEYQDRFAIDDPLISHSLSDLWGYNPGVELYGSWRKLSYVVAVQNGGISTLNDGTADKSVTGRIGYDPLSWLHLSASAMRTGDLSVQNDGVSAIWFGGGLFQSIGSTNTTLFHVNLAELDASAKWKRGYVKLAGGYADYNDNDPTPVVAGSAGAGGYGTVSGGTPTADHHRDIYYYYVEALQHLTPKIYGVTRFSQIRAAGGYPIEGDTATFGLPTSDLWRLSLGLGYQLNSHLVLKAEYMFEQGQLSTDGPRNHENMFATEAAFKF
jgi:hypothetical protein